MNCPRCGLNLNGLTGNTCPRCGQPVQMPTGSAQPGQPGYGWPQPAPPSAPSQAYGGRGQPSEPSGAQQPGWGQPASGSGYPPSGWGQPSEPSGYQQQPGWGQPADGAGWGQPAAPSSPYGGSSSYGTPPSYGGQPSAPTYGSPSAPSSYGSPSAPSSYGSPSAPSSYGSPSPSSGYGMYPPAGPSRPLGGGMSPSAPVAPPKVATKRAGLGRGVVSALVGIALLVVIGVGVGLGKGALFNAVNGPTDSYSLTSTDAGWVDDATGCAFKSDGYHITQSVICYAPSNDLSNGTASVTISQVSGDRTLPYGLVFHRVSEGNFYAFQIDSQGDYALTKVVNKAEGDPLAHGTSTAIATGTGAKNTLTVQISGTHLTLLINGTQVGQADDSTFSSGKTGLAGNDGIDVVFTDFTIQR